MKSILIIDDREELHTLIKTGLGSDFRIDSSYNGVDFNQKIKKQNYDIYIIDLYLEGENGLDIFQKLKDNNPHRQSVYIILTASEEVQDEIRGHELGIHEYLKKPVHIKLLRTVIEKNLKSLGLVSERYYEDNHLKIDTFERTVKFKHTGQLRADFTQSEIRMLGLLMNKKGSAVTRDELADGAIISNDGNLSRTVDVHLSSLRKKLGDHYGNFIKTVRGVGYRYLGPDNY